MRKQYTAETAAIGVEDMLRLIEGRWKLIILFHLFDGKVQRYSDLEKLIPAISQKMLAQQLRQLERDGIVARTVYPEVPPKVEYRLTAWGQALCPVLDSLLLWGEQRDAQAPAETAAAVAGDLANGVRRYRDGRPVHPAGDSRADGLVGIDPA